MCWLRPAQMCASKWSVLQPRERARVGGEVQEDQKLG
jgi:hypothetical protein